VPLDAPDGSIADEGPLARVLAANHSNLDHFMIDAAGRFIGDSLDENFYYCEFPALNLCNLVWLSEIGRQMKRRGERVLLVGAYGNGTISQKGLERLSQLLRRGDLLTWSREAIACVQTGQGGALWALHRSIGPSLPPRLYQRLLTSCGRAGNDLATVSSLRPELLEEATLQDFFKAAGYDPTLQPMKSPRQVAEFILRRMDLSSLVRKGQLAACGVDERDPTSDRRLIEFTLSMPSRLLLRRGQTRWIYHQAFADRVPAEIRRQRRRGYQASDWLERLRQNPAATRDAVGRASRSAAAGALLDIDFMTACAERPLPAKADKAVTEAYRFKFLRGVSAAHFIAKTEGKN
jgi:asparagine synthase (glutamine-hydrolysing)